MHVFRNLSSKPVIRELSLTWKPFQVKLHFYLTFHFNNHEFLSKGAPDLALRYIQCSRHRQMQNGPPIVAMLATYIQYVCMSQKTKTFTHIKTYDKNYCTLLLLCFLLNPVHLILS